jgi:hypothetical protein
VFLPECSYSVGETPPGSRLRARQSGEWPNATGAAGGSVDLSLIPGPEARSQDFIRIEGLAEGWYGIVNPRRNAGFALRWDATLFPVLGFWQVFRGALDYPWYGMNYLAALEPACDLPSLDSAAASGRAIVLQPGQPVRTRIEATAFRGIPAPRRVEWGGEIA